MIKSKKFKLPKGKDTVDDILNMSDVEEVKRNIQNCEAERIFAFWVIGDKIYWLSSMGPERVIFYFETIKKAILDGE